MSQTHPHLVLLQLQCHGSDPSDLLSPQSRYQWQHSSTKGQFSSVLDTYTFHTNCSSRSLASRLGSRNAFSQNGRIIMAYVGLVQLSRSKTLSAVTDVECHLSVQQSARVLLVTGDKGLHANMRGAPSKGAENAPKICCRTLRRG